MHLKVPGSDRCYLFSTSKKKEMWSYLLFHGETNTQNAIKKNKGGEAALQTNSRG